MRDICKDSQTRSGAATSMMSRRFKLHTTAIRAPSEETTSGPGTNPPELAPYRQGLNAGARLTCGTVRGTVRGTAPASADSLAELGGAATGTTTDARLARCVARTKGVPRAAHDRVEASKRSVLRPSRRSMLPGRGYVIARELSRTAG